MFGEWTTLNLNFVQKVALNFLKKQQNYLNKSFV